MQIFHLLFLFGVVLTSCDCSKFEKDITITHSQKKMIDQLRYKMNRRFEHSYMKEDMYLIRWLRASDFILEKTQQMLLENLRWRKENNIDNLDKEDWSYFKKTFPYSVNAVNKMGQPLLIMDQDKWNVREAVVTGRREKLAKWFAKMLEDATIKVRDIQEAGGNVTRFNILNTLENFNLVESGCFQCLSVYMSFTNYYETYYPNMLDEMILVNTPGIFDAVLRVLKPLMSPSTRNALRIIGTNKRQWKMELLDEIDEDQLPPEFGGTNYELFEDS